MSKTIELIPHTTEDELKEIIRTTKDEGAKTRVKVILQIVKGLSRNEIHTIYTINIDTITDIVKRFNKDGVSSFVVSKGGRKEGNPKWETSIFEDLVCELKKQEQYYTIPKMVKWVKDKKNVEIPKSTMWYQLTRNYHLSYKSARPHPYLGNKDVQESFKKRV